jgi:hypothetical protein
MGEPKGPNFDRFLMRFKDFIIIGTAIAALANWIYKRSEGQEQRFRVVEERLANVERVLLNRK